MVKVIIIISMALCFGQNIPQFDGNRAMNLLIKQCDFGPRYPGSEGHEQMKIFMESKLRIKGLFMLLIS